MLHLLLLQLIRLKHLLVLLGLVHAEVVQDLPALRDFGEESPAGGFILRVFLQMFCQKIDFRGKNRNLDVRRSRILVVYLMFADELFLDCAGKHDGDLF